MPPRQSRRLAGLAAEVQELPATRPRKKNARGKPKSKRVNTGPQGGGVTKTVQNKKHVKVTASDKELAKAAKDVVENPNDACAHERLVQAARRVATDPLNSAPPKVNQPRTVYQSLSARIRTGIRRVATFSSGMKEPLKNEAARFAREQLGLPGGWKGAVLTCASFAWKYREEIKALATSLLENVEVQRVLFAGVRGGGLGVMNFLPTAKNNFMTGYMARAPAPPPAPHPLDALILPQTGR